MMDNTQGLGEAMEVSSTRERLEKLERAAQGQDHILQFFAFAHLPPFLQAVSKPFAELANSIVLDLPRNPDVVAEQEAVLEVYKAALGMS